MHVSGTRECFYLTTLALRCLVKPSTNRKHIDHASRRLNWAHESRPREDLMWWAASCTSLQACERLAGLANGLGATIAIAKEGVVRSYCKYVSRKHSPLKFVNLGQLNRRRRFNTLPCSRPKKSVSTHVKYILQYHHTSSEWALHTL